MEKFENKEINKNYRLLSVLFILISAGIISINILDYFKNKNEKEKYFIADEIIRMEENLVIKNGEIYQDAIFKIIQEGDTLDIQALINDGAIDYWEDNGKHFFKKDDWKEIELKNGEEETSHEIF